MRLRRTAWKKRKKRKRDRVWSALPLERVRWGGEQAGCCLEWFVRLWKVEEKRRKEAEKRRKGERRGFCSDDR
jgi:hypothetical protein